MTFSCKQRHREHFVIDLAIKWRGKKDRILRPKGLKDEVRRGERGGVLGEGVLPPPHQLESLESAISSPSMPGQSPADRTVLEDPIPV